MDDDFKVKAYDVCEAISQMSLGDQVEALNAIRSALHNVGPFSSEPVDLVQWVPAQTVTANDYNPNSVAPPEMELLRVSINADGYTQPVVGNKTDDGYEVVDGFHRTRVAKEMPDIAARVKGYLPIVQIRPEQIGRSERIASTIRHNRARGKHKVEAMSDIVIELKRRNWTDAKIAKELGMDQDEILRLCQISGLADIFRDQAFSQAWEPEGAISVEDFVGISGIASDYVGTDVEVRTSNTDDESRIFHTFDTWECYKAGFYSTTPPRGMRPMQCQETYKEFLADLDRFEAALAGVIRYWEKSCEHYLTNVKMNRIAWLGQAALCYETGISSEFRGGYFLLTEDQQRAANEMALKYLNRWMEANGRPEVTMEDATTDLQAEVY